MVNCTLVLALRLCTGRTAHSGSRGIALLFLDDGIRRGWGVSVTTWPLFAPGKTRFQLYRRLGGPGPRAGPDRCGKSRSHQDRSPDRPARSQSLYRLSYPAHTHEIGKSALFLWYGPRSVNFVVHSVCPKRLPYICCYLWSNFHYSWVKRKPTWCHLFYYLFNTH